MPYYFQKPDLCKLVKFNELFHCFEISSFSPCCLLELILTAFMNDLCFDKLKCNYWHIIPWLKICPVWCMLLLVADCITIYTVVLGSTKTHVLVLILFAMSHQILLTMLLNTRFVLFELILIMVCFNVV